MRQNPLNDGKRRGKSKRIERHQDKDDMMLTQFSLLPLLNPQSSRLESVVEVKKTTLIDRLSFLSLVTPDVKSSKTSGVDSTSKGKGLSPYWNGFCQATSEWLSLPQKIDCADSDLI
jgi:hypothetical protein